MKPVISPEYAALNRKLHEDRPDYGAGAARDAPAIAKLCTENRFTSVLDYGCGKGTLKPALAEIAPDVAVFEYDPAVPGKDSLPARQVDLVLALDVMEHVEPEYLEGVLQAFHDIRPRAVFLVIATRPALKHLPDGRNAHLIVESVDWWTGKLGRYFAPAHKIIAAGHFTYIGVPK